MQTIEGVKGRKYIIRKGLYGGDLDTPENVVIYVSNKTQEHLSKFQDYADELIDYIIEAVWKKGDKVIEATDKVAFYIEDKDIYVHCFIDTLDKKWKKGLKKCLEERHGFFISVFKATNKSADVTVKI